MPVRVEVGPRDLAEGRSAWCAGTPARRSPCPWARWATAVPRLLEDIQASMLAGAVRRRDARTVGRGQRRRGRRGGQVGLRPDALGPAGRRRARPGWPRTPSACAACSGPTAPCRTPRTSRTWSPSWPAATDRSGRRPGTLPALFDRFAVLERRGPRPTPLVCQPAVHPGPQPKEVSSMATADRVQLLVEPILEAEGLELFDLELDGGVLRVLVDRRAAPTSARCPRWPGPCPAPWTSTIRSTAVHPRGEQPGLERPLRTPAHFARARRRHREGQDRSPAPTATRRAEARITAADDEPSRVAGRRRARPARVRLRRHRAGPDGLRLGPRSEATKRRRRQAMSNLDMERRSRRWPRTRGSRSTRCSARSPTRSSRPTSACPAPTSTPGSPSIPTPVDIRVFAQELDEDGEPFGDEFDVTPDDFGRIAARRPAR